MVKFSLVQPNKKQQKITLIVIMIGISLFIALKPKVFLDFWLTKDQQGQLLFYRGDYQQASKTFTNTLWKAYSAYGNEDYKTAATLYSQFNDKHSLLAKSNALAHSREYLKARNSYQDIIDIYPDYLAAQTNIVIVQAIIDEVNMLSEAQQAEEGESIKELGDEPQTADGAEKKEARTQKIEQLSSEQLLLDEDLNNMWLRQVQKDPARFLSQKFYFQHELIKKSAKKELTNEE